MGLVAGEETVQYVLREITVRVGTVGGHLRWSDMARPRERRD